MSGGLFRDSKLDGSDRWAEDVDAVHDQGQEKLLSLVADYR